MDAGSELHFLNEVVGVVAGTTVAAEPDINASGQQQWQLQEARSKLGVRGRIMGDMCPGASAVGDVGLVKPAAVGNEHMRPREPNLLAVLHRPLIELPPEILDVCKDFGNMDGDTHMALARD